LPNTSSTRTHSKKCIDALPNAGTYTASPTRKKKPQGEETAFLPLAAVAVLHALAIWRCCYFPAFERASMRVAVVSLSPAPVNVTFTL